MTDKTQECVNEVVTRVEPVEVREEKSLTSSQLVKQDLFGRGRHYLDNLRSCSSLEEFMALNQQDFGASLLGADKFCASTLFGYCSGYTIKSAMRIGALACGIGFISLQALNYYGYVDVKWGKIQKEFETQFDVNKDGKIDAEDFARIRDKTLRILTWGLPSAAGFGVGFYWAMK